MTLLSEPLVMPLVKLAVLLPHLVQPLMVVPPVRSVVPRMLLIQIVIAQMALPAIYIHITV